MELSFNQKIIYGALVLGVVFPIAGVTMSLMALELPFSFKSIVQIHVDMPSNYLIDMAPIILPLVAYYVTVMVDNRGASKNELEQRAKFEKVEKYVAELGKGNFSAENELARSGDNIGLALEELKNNLHKNSSLEDQRKWQTEGLSQFSEVLRDNSENIEELSRVSIRELVKYVGARFGGFYFLDDSRKKKLLKLTGSYAYDFKVKEKQSFEIGEGMVGQCFKNKEPIVLENIPEDYTYKIESGLGESSPSVIVFVPLIANEVPVGVLEIASFKEIEEYKVDFMQRLSESIAIYIQNVKNAANTKDLLEESQFMSQQLQAQEEELRQNAEELQATQEEIERKLSETEDVLDSERKRINSIINSSLEGIIVVSDKGKLKEYNPAFQKLLGYTKTDLGKISLEKIFGLKEDIIEFLTNNIDQQIEIEVKSKKEEELWVNIAISKIEIEDEVSYSMFIADITETKHSVATMEESLMEFQSLMMEQTEIQQNLEQELEETKKKLEELKK